MAPTPCYEGHGWVFFFPRGSRVGSRVFGSVGTAGLFFIFGWDPRTVKHAVALVDLQRRTVEAIDLQKGSTASERSP